MQNISKLLGSRTTFALYSANDFLKRQAVQFELNIPLIITSITNENSNDIAKKLLDLFEANTTLAVLLGSEVFKVALDKFEGLADAIFIEGQPFTQRKRYTFGDLVEVIRRLRDPNGCQWDREQTHKSIRGNAIEEAYELVEAIDLDDKDKILEESGDVFLQGLFHAVIAEDRGAFNTNDMVSNLCQKLVFRHTHIFGDNAANNADEALSFWEKAKAKEKGQRSVSDKIDSVPKTFSALMRAHKIQKIAAKAGFDFSIADQIAEKVLEELDELKNAYSKENMEEEAGDLLFAAVNLVRFLKIDPEVALNRTTAKFVNRFTYVDKRAKENGGAVTDFSDEVKEGWYREYKELYENR
ncbi:MAG: nucleoside triphosphate pyrophosphohydrolase [Clostridia bacterium]